MTLDVQFFTMIAMIGSGFYLGAMYDTFRRFSPYWKGRPFLVYFMEISFWLTQTLIIFYILYRVNAGEIRFYIFVAVLLGFSIYQVFAATIYKRILEHIIRIIIRIYQFFARLVQVLLIQPIIWIVTIIITIVLGILRFAWKLLFFLFNIIFAPLRWIGKGIYQILPKSFQNYLHQFAGFYSRIKNIVISQWKKFKRR